MSVNACAADWDPARMRDDAYRLAWCTAARLVGANPDVLPCDQSARFVAADGVLPLDCDVFLPGIPIKDGCAMTERRRFTARGVFDLGPLR